MADRDSLLIFNEEVDVLAVATTDKQVTTTEQQRGEGNVTAPNAATVRGAPAGGTTVKGRQVDPVGVYGSEERPIYEISDPAVFGEVIAEVIAEVKEELGPVGAQVTFYDNYTGLRLINDDDDSVSLKLSRITTSLNTCLRSKHQAQAGSANGAVTIDAFPGLKSIQGGYN
jgi:hypothetical protein